MDRGIMARGLLQKLEADNEGRECAPETWQEFGGS